MPLADYGRRRKKKHTHHPFQFHQAGYDIRCRWKKATFPKKKFCFLFYRRQRQQRPTSVCVEVDGKETALEVWALLLLVFELWMLRAFLQKTHGMPGGCKGCISRGARTASHAPTLSKMCSLSKKAFGIKKSWVIQFMPELEFTILIFHFFSPYVNMWGWCSKEL